MQKLTLQYPIRTSDHQLLFAQKTLLTKETLDALIASSGTHSCRTSPVLWYGSVKQDCLDFLRVPPFMTIFSDQEEINELLNLMETVRFPIPILQSLDYFKANDFYTYVHVLMVFVLSTILAKDLLPDYQERIRLSVTGPTHDTGKVCVPLHILKKTSPLTRRERGFLEHHAAAGYVLLSYYYKDPQHLGCRVALDHHERRDRSGYPRGIVLEDRMVEIIAACDVYDALIMPRPYRSGAYDNRTALEEMTDMAKQNKIGWDVVKALIARNRKSNPHYKLITISAEKRGTPPSHNVYGMIEEETDAED
jgi:HD-GYP domain-containing protein (c-di-GMP phosphodiesterase class II)